MEVSSSSSEPVVVIGAGFAGLMTALSLSAERSSPPIILVEPRSKFVFLPLLYELLSEEVQSWEIAPSYRSLIVDRGISILHDCVESIQITNKKIVLSSGRALNYGKLVIASGSQSKAIGVPSLKNHALTFNDLDDVSKLKNIIRKIHNNRTQGENLLIVGAGPSGIELACKLADMIDGKREIHLIEIKDRVLPDGKSFNQEQALIALKKKKIKLHLNTNILNATANTLELKCDSIISTLNYEDLIWTGGSKPSCFFGLPNQTINNGKICIDSNLQVIGLNDVFAIGDVAISMKNALPATAQVAMQQAAHLAKNLIFSYKKSPLKSFEFRDQGEMLSLGIGNATITSSGFTLSGSLAFKLRRIAYLSKIPSLSLGIRSAGAWLIDSGKNLM